MRRQDSYLFFIRCSPGLKASFDSSFEKLLQLLQAGNGPLPLLHWKVQPHTPLPSSCVEVMTQGIKHLPCMFASASLLQSKNMQRCVAQKGAAYVNMQGEASVGCNAVFAYWWAQDGAMAWQPEGRKNKCRFVICRLAGACSHSVLAALYICVHMHAT